MPHEFESRSTPDTGQRPETSAIQPHGVLLAIDAAGCVGALAGATGQVFGRAPQDLLGKPIGTVLDVLVPADPPATPHYVGTWVADHGDRWELSAHRSGTYTLLEFEPAPVEHDAATAIADIHRACAAFECCADVQALSVACAKAIRRLSGFDRVTVHRFVSHEAVVMAVDETASAMPPPGRLPSLPWVGGGQALVQVVPEVDYSPAPVLCARTDDDRPRIGHCVLRGIDPVERGHLRDQGVAASLWLPIVLRGRRWGAVVCHHATPRLSSSALRTACRLVVRECALRIDACESDERERAGATQHALRGQASLLVQEANHRVHNSLHIAASMLQLQARQSSRADVRSELEAAAGRLAAVGAVHRQLSRPDHAREVRLDTYLGQLCTDLARSWGAPWMEQLTVDVCAVALVADKAISLGLVVTELLTNAAKYAYRGAPGPVALRAEPHGTWLHVTVSDGGQGMRRDVDGTGLGSRLNRLFAAQLGGDIELSSGEAGTTVTVRIPMPQPRHDDASGAMVEAGAG